MPKQRAGLLIYRRRDGQIEIFLVHPGGPFWEHKDIGAWSIPKGEFAASDDPLETARRELIEETGVTIADPFAPLEPIRQRGKKTVLAWLVYADFDPGPIQSNMFELDWPRDSGKISTFPEVDRAEWFPLHEAGDKILDSQRPLLEQLRSALADDPGGHT